MKNFKLSARAKSASKCKNFEKLKKIGKDQKVPKAKKFERIEKLERIERIIKKVRHKIMPKGPKGLKLCKFEYTVKRQKEYTLMLALKDITYFNFILGRFGTQGFDHFSKILSSGISRELDCMPLPIMFLLNE